MKRRFRISTLALAGFVSHGPAEAAVTPELGADGPDLDRRSLIEVFRGEHSFDLAGHRSHSSHSSHRSSSGGGGGHSSHSSHRSSASAPAPRSTPSSRNNNSTPPSNVLPSSPATAPKTLKGNTSQFKEIVRQVQIALATRNYYYGAVDGLYGPETRAALVRFQSDSGLEVTGTITQGTLDALAIVAR